MPSPRIEPGVGALEGLLIASIGSLVDQDIDQEAYRESVKRLQSLVLLMSSNGDLNLETLNQIKRGSRRFRSLKAISCTSSGILSHGEIPCPR